jgi:hypothetical protein
MPCPSTMGARAYLPTPLVYRYNTASRVHLPVFTVGNTYTWPEFAHKICIHTILVQKLKNSRIDLDQACVRSELKGALGKKEQELPDPRSEGFALGLPGGARTLTSYQQCNNSQVESFGLSRYQHCCSWCRPPSNSVCLEG